MPLPGDYDYEPPSQRPATVSDVAAVERTATDALQAANEARDAAERTANFSVEMSRNIGCQFWMLMFVGIFNALLLALLLFR